MTPEQLKSSLFLMAIQGKIVEQRAEEGTGEDLYNQIQKEKQRLVTAGDIKSTVLDDITDEELPFDIPSSWKWVRHNDLFEIVGGSQPPKSNFKDSPDEGDVRLYQIRDYGETPVPVYVDRKLVSKFTKEGDILLARYGGSLGKVFWAKEGAYNVAMAKIVMLYKTDLIDKTYLYYYYLAPLYQNLVRGSNRAAQGGFNKDDLNALMFPLPPLKEQHRIVAKIEELLPYVDRYAEAYEKLEQFNAKFPEDMKKSILQYAIQGKLVEQRPEEGTAEELYQQIQKEKQKLIKEGKIKKEKPLAEITEDEIPFDIPKSWRWVRVGDVCEGFEYGTAKKSAESGKIAVLRMGNIQKGKVIFDNLVYSNDDEDIKKYNLVPGDLLFNRTNSKEWVGKTAIYEGEKKAIYAGYLVRFRPICIVSKYLNYVMQTQYYWSFCQRERTDAIGQSNINAQKLKRFCFPLPPIEEQHRIVTKIEELLPYCDRLVK